MRTRHLPVVMIVPGLALIMSMPCPANDFVNKENIDKLIDQLGSGSFVEREKASKQLADIGLPALEALRKAAKSEDAEVRKRAEEILPRIERQADSVRILAPKRVHLTYKDTPLGEAVDDFQKKSGYGIQLHDPEEKLKQRRITLETGETSFWRAFALFCEKAELSEASIEDLMRQMRVPQRPGGLPFPPPAGQPMNVNVIRSLAPVGIGQLIVKDGKAKPLPTDDHSAARIRVLGKSDQAGNVPDGEIMLVLEVSLEPKLQWQVFQTVHVEKAVDDHDQKLSQVIAQVEGAGGIAGNPAFPVPAGPAGLKMQRMQQMQRQMRMQMQVMGRPGMGWSSGGLSQHVPVQLKKGAKDAKTLKELQGVITAQVLTEARPVITADNLGKATDKTFKGDQGGSIKIVEVKAEENETSVQLELEQPPYDKVMPAQANLAAIGMGVRAIAPQPGMRNPLQPPPPPPPPAPKPQDKAVPPPAGQAQPRQPQAAPPLAKREQPKQPPAPQPQQVRAPAAKPMLRQFAVNPWGGPAQLMDSMNGLSIQDEKGNTLPIDASRSHMSVSIVQQANGPAKQALIWTLVCPHDKAKGKPSKVVFLGRKSLLVDIPFVLTDVPLP